MRRLGGVCHSHHVLHVPSPSTASAWPTSTPVPAILRSALKPTNEWPHSRFLLFRMTTGPRDADWDQGPIQGGWVHLPHRFRVEPPHLPNSWGPEGSQVRRFGRPTAVLWGWFNANGWPIAAHGARGAVWHSAIWQGATYRERTHVSPCRVRLARPRSR